MISNTIIHVIMYSDSTDDLQTVFCFLNFHEANELPNLIQKLVMVSWFLGNLLNLNRNRPLTGDQILQEKTIITHVDF